MFSLLLSKISCCTNSWVAGDLKRHDPHVNSPVVLTILIDVGLYAADVSGMPCAFAWFYPTVWPGDAKHNDQSLSSFGSGNICLPKQYHTIACKYIGFGRSRYDDHYIDGLVHGCSNSSVLAMELLQSCTKPSICHYDGCRCPGAESAPGHLQPPCWHICNSTDYNSGPWTLLYNMQIVLHPLSSLSMTFKHVCANHLDILWRETAF